MDKYLVPPRLTKKLIYYGLTFTEMLFIAVTFVFAFVAKLYFLVFVPAVIFVLSVRIVDGEMNILTYGKKVYNYFFKTQSFSSLGDD